LQAANPEPERELAAGKLAAEQGGYEDAAEHFNRANELRQDKCSECYVWLARLEMAEGKLDQALIETGKAIATSISGPERGRAQLYRGLVLVGRQGDLAQAEIAFKAAADANPECLECRVSLPLLKELAAKAVPAKLAIISVDEGDPRQKWEQYIQDSGMTWAQVYDANRSLYRAFGVDAFPRYFILSRDGIILEQFKGWNQDGKATISDAIARALAQ